MFKIFWFGRTVVLGATRKNRDDDKAVNMSCRHAGPNVCSLCLLMVRSRSLAGCLGLELFCVAVAKCLSSDLSLKNWYREKFPCQTLLFLPFLSILFPIDRKELFSNVFADPASLLQLLEKTQVSQK